MLQALRMVGIAEVVRKAGNKATSVLFHDPKAMTRFREENIALFAEWMALPAGEAGKVRAFLMTDEDGGRIIPADYEAERYPIYLLAKSSSSRSTDFPTPTWSHSGDAENMLARLHKTISRRSYDNDPVVKKLRETIKMLTPDTGKKPLDKKNTYLLINTTGIDASKNLLAHLRNPPLTAQEKKEKHKILYSFRVNGKYPIESPAVIRGFIEDREQTLKEYKKTLVTGNGVCTLCGLEGPVTGNAVPFNFYVLDKTTYFPDTSTEASWKVNPICFTCADLLEIGRGVIDAVLNVRLAGYNCKVIPSLITPSKTQQDIGQWLDRFRRIIDGSVIEGSGEKARKERLLSKKLGEAGVAGSYHFLIYQENQAQMEIIRQIDDILPSRISEVAKAIDEVNQTFHEHPVFGSDKEPLLNLSFGFLSWVFGHPASKKGYRPQVISIPDLLYRIFTKHTVPWSTVVREFSGKLAHHYRDQEIDNPRSFLLGEIRRMMEAISLFEKLEVLTMPAVNQIIKFNSGNHALDDFVNQKGSLLSDPQRQVCFLTGVLFGKAEAVQFACRGSAPIHKWLKSLNLSDRELRDLLGRLVNKLKEYKSMSKEMATVADVLSVLWNRTGPWQLGKDDIRFFFTMGWTTCDRFLPKKNSDENKTEDQHATAK